MMTAEDIFKLMTLFYWAAMLSLVAVVWFVVLIALRSPKRWWIGCLGTVIILVLFIGPVAQTAFKNKRENTARKQAYESAKAVFDERCKNAGIKIYRTVEDVEGVTLLNVWQFEPRNGNPMWEYAGLPHSAGGDGYVQGFLSWRSWDYKIDDFDNYGNGFTLNAKYLNSQNKDSEGNQYLNSYLYVDVLQNDAYQRYQYKKLYDPREVVITATNKPSRYTVKFENPIIPADRKIWLATTKATIKDSETGEVLGEATWYSLHGGQGVKTYSTTGIWNRAITCPNIANSQHYPIQYFVLKVLKPKQIPQRLQPKTTETTDVKTLAPNTRFNQRN